MSLVDFHKELRVVFTSYYKDIVKMDGASSVNQKVAYKRQIKRLHLEVPLPPAGEGAAAEADGGAAAAEVANASEPAPPAEPAAAAAKPARRGKGGN